MYEYVKSLGDKIEYKNVKELNKIAKNSFNSSYIKNEIKNKNTIIEEGFIDDLKYLKRLLNSFTSYKSHINNEIFDNMTNYFKCISEK